MNPATREPVLTGMLVRVVMAAAARYGFDLSADDVLQLWGAAEVILAIWTRTRVSPVQPS